MKSPLARIRLGFVVLATTFAIAVLGYRFAGKGYDWLDSIYMVVITISTVGFGEHSDLETHEQLLTLFVILVGVSAAFYTCGGFLQLLLEGEIERILGHRRMTLEIDRLNGHTIICGYGRMGQVLAAQLSAQGRPFVIIDEDAERIVQAGEADMLCLTADATEEDTLIKAGVERAETLVSGLPTDAANVFIALTARNLNERLQIIARAEHETTVKKLRQAGANRVVMPAVIGAQRMVRMITKPTTADLMDFVSEASFQDLELDEILLPANSRLAGMTILDTQAHAEYGMLFVAIKGGESAMEFNPRSTYEFKIGDTLLVLGHCEDIARFCDDYDLS